MGTNVELKELEQLLERLIEERDAAFEHYKDLRTAVEQVRKIYDKKRSNPKTKIPDHFWDHA